MLEIARGRVGGHEMDVEDVLRESISKICEIPEARVSLDTRLDALGIDSLAVAEIIVELEIRLDRQLPLHLLRELSSQSTVADVLREIGAAG
jgi:acyl carrier protein